MGLAAQGTTFEVRNAADDAFITVGKIVDINGPNSSRPEIDDTTLDSTGAEFLLGLIDNGEVQLTLSYTAGDLGQQELNALLDNVAAPSRAVQITFPVHVDAGHTTGTVLAFAARVSSGGFAIATGDRITQNVTLRVTGARTLTEGS